MKDTSFYRFHIGAETVIECEPELARVFQGDVQNRDMVMLDVSAAVDSRSLLWDVVRFKAAVLQVCIFFDNKLLRGNRALKYSSTDFDAFQSPNIEPLATVGVDIKVSDPKNIQPAALQ